MSEDDLNINAAIEISAGHLLVVWDVLANKLSEAACIKELTDDERRAIWALQDLCESALSNIGFGARPEHEWEQLMGIARAYVSKIPVEFLE